MEFHIQYVQTKIFVDVQWFYQQLLIVLKFNSVAANKINLFNNIGISGEKNMFA